MASRWSDAAPRRVVKPVVANRHAVSHLRHVEEVRRVPVLERRDHQHLAHGAIRPLRLRVQTMQQTERVDAVHDCPAFVEQSRSDEHALDRRLTQDRFALSAHPLVILRAVASD